MSHITLITHLSRKHYSLVVFRFSRTGTVSVLLYATFQNSEENTDAYLSFNKHVLKE